MERNKKIYIYIFHSNIIREKKTSLKLSVIFLLFAKHFIISGITMKMRQLYIHVTGGYSAGLSLSERYDRNANLQRLTYDM